MESIFQVRIMRTLTLTLSVAWLAARGCQALTAPEQAYFTIKGVTITTSGTDYIFSHSGIPSHATDNFPTNYNPNSIEAKNYQLYIPQTPAKQSTSTCLPGGIVAMAVNGVALYSPYTAEGHDAVTESSCAEEFDPCKGHPDEQGAYHYHQLPVCVSTGGNDEVIGIALDGFLIYGLKDSTGSMPTDLDECGGKTVSGVYRYHIQDTYPYVLNCYYGITSSQQDVRSKCTETAICASRAVNPFVIGQFIWLLIGAFVAVKALQF